MAPALTLRSVLLPVGWSVCVRLLVGRVGAYTRGGEGAKGRAVVTNCPAWIYLGRSAFKISERNDYPGGRHPTWNQLPL